MAFHHTWDKGQFFFSPLSVRAYFSEVTSCVPSFFLFRHVNTALTMPLHRCLVCLEHSSQIYKELAVLCHSGLTQLGCHLPWLLPTCTPHCGLHFIFFKAYNCLIISFIYLPIFCIPLLHLSLIRMWTFLPCLAPSIVLSLSVKAADSGIRFTSLDAIVDTHCRVTSHQLLHPVWLCFPIWNGDHGSACSLLLLQGIKDMIHVKYF